MKSTLTRSGGFSGIQLKKTIDTDSLPQDEKEKFESLFENMQVSKYANDQIQNLPDEFCYTISVEDGEKAQSFTLPESQAPKGIKDLFQLLRDP